MVSEQTTELRMLNVLRKAIWNTGTATADEAVLEEMKKHAVEALAGPVLQELSLSPELFKDWERLAVRTFIHFQRYQAMQAALPVEVPYVVLKGTSAAQYYPHPAFRAMGDIDIMTSHEDYQKACDMLLLHHFVEETNAVEQRVNRHRTFARNDIQIEIHSFYALRDKKEETKALDDLIIDHISPTHILPDLVNGLTLIEHINHHLEGGLGLRQILDWMMFVDKCLSDDNWPEFEKMARRTGHVKLSIVTTRMCELYLGLPEHAWCSKADPVICGNLMDYVLSCGNFGRKRDGSLISEQLLSGASGLSRMKLLKQKGMLSWKLAQKHPWLEPLAGYYQLGKYLLKGLQREKPLKNLKNEYRNSRKRNALFNAVGVSREEKGRVIYRDGEYINNTK